MNNTYRSFIIYNLSKSITTQSLLTPKIEKAWEKVRTFLNICTIYDKPNTFELTAYEPWKNENSESFTKIIQSLENTFGKTERKPQGYMFPSGKETSEGQYEWKFNYNQFPRVLDYMIKNQPWLKSIRAPVVLTIFFYFYWIDLETRNLLPYQDNNCLIPKWETKSHLMLCLERNSSISIDGRFPFQEPNQEFWNYIEKIEPYFPCRFNEKYLQLGIPNKKGTNYYFRKLEKL